MDWTEAESQIRPLLANRDYWPRIRHELEKREVTMLALTGPDPLRPRAIQADANISGWRISAGVDWTGPDPIRDAFEELLDEIDTPDGTPGTQASSRRPTRHGIGKKGRRNH
jgi:hypothetical protein